MTAIKTIPDAATNGSRAWLAGIHGAGCTAGRSSRSPGRLFSLIVAAGLAGMILLGFGPSGTVSRADVLAHYVDNAVILIVDVSNSMSEHERYVARESHAAAITSREVLEAIRNASLGRSAFAYVEFATSARTIIDWRVIDSTSSAQSFAERIRLSDDARLGGLTGIGEGLQEAVRLFRRLPFAATRKVVDITGDGISNVGRDISGPRAVLLGERVVINGLPMILDTRHHDLVAYFQNEIVGGAGAFALTLERIEEMPMMMRQKIFLELF